MHLLHVVQLAYNNLLRIQVLVGQLLQSGVVSRLLWTEVVQKCSWRQMTVVLGTQHKADQSSRQVNDSSVQMDE